MLFIFGDSHAQFNMKDFKVPHYNLCQYSITMHRVGRDNIIPNFYPIMDQNTSIFMFFYGEVDARCHIYKQIQLATRGLEEIVTELVEKYIQTIKNNIKNGKVVVGSVTPSIRRREYEDVHGPVQHEFPFMGTDEERVLYTKMLNELLEKKCLENGFKFLNTFNYYARPDGTMKYELSDGICHIKQNGYILEMAEKLIISLT